MHVNLARCEMCRIRSQFHSRAVLLIPIATPFVMVPIIIWRDATTTLLVVITLIAMWCVQMAGLAREGTAAGRSQAAQQAS